MSKTYKLTIDLAPVAQARTRAAKTYLDRLIKYEEASQWH